MPPLSTSTSWDSSISPSLGCIEVSSSRRCSSPTVSKPCSRSEAVTAYAFERRIWCSAIGWPGSISSSPVEMTMMRGWRLTSIAASPAEATTAISAAPSRMPGVSIATPGSLSEPRRCTLRHGSAIASGFSCQHGRDRDRIPRAGSRCRCLRATPRPSSPRWRKWRLQGASGTAPAACVACKAKDARARMESSARHRNAVHADAIEWRIVALRLHFLRAECGRCRAAARRSSAGSIETRERMTRSASPGVSALLRR